MPDPERAVRNAAQANDRLSIGFVKSLLRMVGLDWAVPDFSTLCRRQRTLDVKLAYRGGAGPLSLLIDSTGIKSEVEGE